MDPLAELKDIHLPDPISWWPLAIGWWVLLAMIIILVVVLISKYRQHRQRTLIKRAALAQLSQENLSTQELLSLLKSSCMNYFPRKDCAQLYGHQLSQYLTEKLPPAKQAEFAQLFNDAIDTIYQKATPAANTETLRKAVNIWLNHALPAKSVGGNHA